MGRPVVEVAEARLDHRVVEHPAELALELEVVVELTVGGVAVGEDAPHGEEDVDRSAAWVGEDGAAAGDAAEREPRRGDERVRVQDARKDDVEEEALDAVLVCGEIPMLEVRGDDARVVRAVQAGAVG